MTTWVHGGLSESTRFVRYMAWLRIPFFNLFIPKRILRDTTHQTAMRCPDESGSTPQCCRCWQSRIKADRVNDTLNGQSHVGRLLQQHGWTLICPVMDE